jgi:hypothetical protein
MPFPVERLIYITVSPGDVIVGIYLTGMRECMWALVADTYLP